MALLLIQTLLVFAASAVGEAGALALMLRRVWRCAPETHWSERARLAWSARLMVGAGPIVVAVFVATQAERFAPHPLATGTLAVAAFLGALTGSLPAMRRLMQRRFRLRDYGSDYLMTFVVLRPSLTVSLLMLALLSGRSLDATSIAIMTVCLVLTVILNFGVLVPLLRLCRMLTPAPPRLVAVVEAAAQRAGMSMPRVDLLRWHAANAFAIIHMKTVAFTPACVEIMSDEELQGVAAHELAHLRESRRQRLARSMGGLLFFPVFTAPVWVAAYGVAGVIIPLLILFAGARLLRGLSQRLEKQADAAAHAQADDEQAYAQALEKLYEYNVVPAVMRGRSQTHPHLYDRLLAAGMQPGYPRPKAPRIWPLLPALAFLLVVSQLPRQLHLRRRFHEPAPEREAWPP